MDTISKNRDAIAEAQRLAADMRKAAEPPSVLEFDPVMLIREAYTLHVARSTEGPLYTWEHFHGRLSEELKIAGAGRLGTRLTHITRLEFEDLAKGAVLNANAQAYTNLASRLNEKADVLWRSVCMRIQDRLGTIQADGFWTRLDTGEVLTDNGPAPGDGDAQSIISNALNTIVSTLKNKVSQGK